MSNFSIVRCDDDRACECPSGCNRKAMVVVLREDETPVIYVCLDHLGETPSAGRLVAMALKIPKTEW